MPRLRRSRQPSIRAVRALIVVVPGLCLLALWAVAADLTASRAVQEHDFAAAE